MPERRAAKRQNEQGWTHWRTRSRSLSYLSGQKSGCYNDVDGDEQDGARLLPMTTIWEREERSGRIHDRDRSKAKVEEGGCALSHAQYYRGAIWIVTHFTGQPAVCDLGETFAHWKVTDLLPPCVTHSFLRHVNIAGAI